jgi:5-methylcytosine-specific restriction endonuclease McrA
MFCSQHEPLALLVELKPKLAKKRFREEIYKAWDHKCGYCQEPATSLDHITPRFKSGSSNRNNLVPCCRRCNANKASSNMEEWFKQQEYFTEEKLAKIKTWMENEIINLSSFKDHYLAS